VQTHAQVIHRIRADVARHLTRASRGEFEVFSLPCPVAIGKTQSVVVLVSFLLLPSRKTLDAVDARLESRWKVVKDRLDVHLARSVNGCTADMGEKATALGSFVSLVGCFGLSVGDVHSSCRVAPEARRNRPVSHQGAVTRGFAVTGGGVLGSSHGELSHRGSDVSPQTNGTFPESSVVVVSECVVVPEFPPVEEAQTKIVRVELARVHKQVVGDAKTHGSVIGPLPRLEPKSVVPLLVPNLLLQHVFELCRAVSHRAELQGCPECITNGIADQAPDRSALLFGE